MKSIKKIEAERDHYKRQAEYWKEMYDEANRLRKIEHEKRVEYYGVLSKLVILSGTISLDTQIIVSNAFRESDKFIDSFYKKKGS